MNLKAITVGVLTTALLVAGTAQSTRPTIRTTSAEFQLIGVRLYDSGVKVVSMYGSPDDIQGLEQGGGGAAGGGGRSPSAGGGGGRAPGGGGASAGTAEMAPAANYFGDPFNTGASDWRQFAPGEDERDGGRDRPTLTPSGGGGGGNPSLPGGGGSGAGGGGGADVQGERVVLTRWVYKRPTGQYAFVFDKFNRVVQIEALGLKDSRVKTRKGLGFGNTVQQLIQKYGAPDAYEVGGTHIILRFIVKDRVAFRLSRLKANDKHRVTGVVVAAGKS